MQTATDRQDMPTGTLVRATLCGGEARVLLCDVTRMARAAREIHQASAVCTAAMGRAIAAAAIMGAQLKGEEESLTMTLRGDGPASPLVAVTRAGAVKVMIGQPAVELPLRDGRLDVGGALGRKGVLGVVRDLGFGEPYTAQVPLVSGEVGEDVALYYTTSEQTPSLCALGVLQGVEEVRAAGGILVQAMPDCSEETLSTLELRSQLFTGLSAMLEEQTPAQVILRCFDGLAPEILEELPIRLACDCDRARIERALISVGARELRAMIDEQHGAEVGCHFCGRKYVFSEAELEALLAAAQSVQ